MKTDEEILDRYIRTCQRPFRFETMYKTVLPELQNWGSEECASYLMSSSYVFSCADGTFVTYAGAFTGKYFCILPTRAEVEQGIFVVGGRCVPFADCAIAPHLLKFRYLDHILESKIGQFASTDAITMFDMFDAEFAPQYIANDPANASIDIAACNYTLPSMVSLTGVIVPCPFDVGDRILCRVANWDKGIIDIVSIMHTGALEINDDDIRRQEWFDDLEKGLLECFEKSGPRGSMYEQLALVFMNNSGALCIPECGTVDECVAQSRKVDFASYGIETRLWRTGEEVPVVGEWNSGEDGMGLEVLNGFILISDYVVSALLTDQLHKKIEDLDAILKVVLPPGVEVSQEEKDAFLLQIKGMYDDMQKNYNWFADAPLAPLREKALLMYQDARNVACTLYTGGLPLGEYSQQALVVYLQVFNNLQKTLHTIQTDPEDALKTLDDISKTLDNMEADVESAQGILMSELENSVSDEDDDFVVTNGTVHEK